MPYIGNELSAQFQAFETQTITGDGSTGYTLDRAVANGKELLVYINNVKQEEGSGKSYTASGTTITFSEAVASTDSCYIVYMGLAMGTITAPDNSVGITQLAVSDGSSGQFLRTDGSGTLSFATVSTSVAFDDVTAGDAAVNVTTTSGDITIDAQGSDTDIIFKGTDGSSDITALTLDMSDAGKAIFNSGVAIGGTGAANTIDDYEEGTWTPAFVGATNTPGLHNNVGRYTRIGRVVVLQFFQQTSGSPTPTFSSNSSAFQISGVPFSVDGHGYTGSQGSMNAQAFHYTGSNNTQSTSADFCSPNVNGSDQIEFQVTASGATRGVMNNTGARAAPYVVEVTISYFTDA